MTVQDNEPLFIGAFRKATASGTQGQCVEVRLAGDRVEVRDSKDPQGPTLLYTPQEWETFLEAVVEGEFSLEALRQSPEVVRAKPLTSV